MVDKLRIYQIAVVSLLLLSLLFLGLLIHYSVKARQNAMESYAEPKPKKEMLKIYYASFFRTDKEQAKFALKFQKSRQVATEGKCPADDRLSEIYHQASTTTISKKRDQTTTNHCCCQSEDIYYSPETAIDENQKNVTLVTYTEKDGEVKRQRFPSETCCQVQEPCECKCTCRQSQTLVRAVVYDPDTDKVKDEPEHRIDEDVDDWVVRNIYIPGCCKCQNSNKKKK